MVLSNYGAGPIGLDDRLYTGVKANSESRMTSALPDWANGKRAMASTGKRALRESSVGSRDVGQSGLGLLR